MKSQVAQTMRGPVEYCCEGSGPVVLICHGTSSDCSAVEMWSPVRDAGFMLVGASRPGYGRTPTATGATNLEAADALTGLLDQLKIETCSIIAVSGGGPTGIALAANHPHRVNRLVLAAAISRTETRQQEAAFESQKAFYGPMHSITWGMLGLMSRISPRSMARQTMAIFSKHDPEDALPRLSKEDMDAIVHFYGGHSSRSGALNDLEHCVDAGMLQRISMPCLVVHSREDASVPFPHAQWSMEQIPHSRLCEAGMTGHFFWIGPDAGRVMQEIILFLREGTAT